MLRRAWLLITLVALCVACSRETEASDEGERLWRQGVWNLDTVGFEPCIPRIEDALDAATGPPNRRTVFLLVSALFFTGRVADAEQLLPIIRDGPPAPGPMLIDGYAASLAGRSGDAEMALSACLTRIRDDDPIAAELRYLAHLRRGLERESVGAIAPAIDDLEIARALLRDAGAPPHHGLVRTLVRAYLVVGDYERAEGVARDATAEDATWAPYAFDFGLVCDIQSYDEEAEAWYVEALARDPNYARPHLKLARLALRRADTTTARQHLERFDELTRDEAAARGTNRDDLAESELASGMGAYWRAVGDAEAAAGDEAAASISYGRAREAFTRALTLSEDCAQTLKQLIQVATLLNEKAEILDVWKRSLERLENAPARAGDALTRTFC